MATRYKDIINSNEVLRSIALEEQNHLPYKVLAKKLQHLSFEKMTSKQKAEVKKHDIKYVEEFWIDTQNNSVSKGKCLRLITMMNIMSTDKSSSKVSCTWMAIRDFWYRTKEYQGKTNSGVELILDPISQICGYKNFRDFVDKEFQPKAEKFKILVLPFTGDILRRKDAETLLVKRYHVLSEKEELPITVSYEHIEGDVYFTHELARKIGIDKKADLLIFGDLYLRNGDKAEINLEYALVQANPITDAHNWSSNITPFRFSELSSGHLPNRIDYIVYWSLGIESYQRKKYEAASKYFGKIIDELQMEDDEVCFRMAVILDLKNRKEEAVNYYKKALSHNKNHYNALLNLGVLFLLNENAGEAKKYLEQFIENFIEPQSNTLYEIGRTYLGVSLKSLGEIELAEKNLTAATGYAGKNPQLVVYSEVWAKAYFELGEIHYTAATEHHEEDCFSKANEFFYHAAKWSKDIHLHEQIAYYFNSQGALHEVYPVIKEYRSSDKRILDLYNKYLQKEKEI